MRVSSKSSQLIWLNNFRRQQEALASNQQQLSTGRRINSAADDPAGTAQILQLQEGLNRIETFRANGDTARRRLSLEENNLNSVNNALDRLRELVIQAGGVVRTTDSRSALADEGRALLDSLLSLANAQDAEGNYLYAGGNVTAQPFSQSGSNFEYNGDDQVRMQRINANRTIAEGNAGSDVFARIRDGNGTFSVSAATTNSGTAFFKSSSVVDPAAWVPDDYSITFTSPTDYEVTDSGGGIVTTGTYSTGDSISFNGVSIAFDGDPQAGDSFAVDRSRNQDLFTTAQNFITAMESASNGPAALAQLQNSVNGVLQDLDRAQENISVVRSSVGSRLAAIDQQNETNEDIALELSTTISTIRDVDYAKVISELETQLTGLQAAQASFARIRSLSLFNFI